MDERIIAQRAPGVEHTLLALRRRLGVPALVLDGGFATELERRGVPLDARLWSARAIVERPGVVSSIHSDYLAAGAHVLSTATYQASLQLLSDAGLDGPTVLRAGVRLARDARDSAGVDARVAASMGPYGAQLGDGSEYRGDYAVTDRELVDFHLGQSEALWEAGPDLLAFETVPSLREAGCIVRALEALGSPPAWISFSLRDPGHVSAGDPVAASLSQVARYVGAVGLNCAPPSRIAEALDRVGALEAELLVYPNSGELWSGSARLWSGVAGGLGSWAERFRRAGATGIGGCCRTTPADIAAIRRALTLDPGSR